MLIVILFIASPSYGEYFYNGQKFYNGASDGAIATWKSAGKQWAWVSQSALLIGSNETFGAGWNGDTGIPEKDDIHAYIYGQLGDVGYDGLDNDTITPTRIALKLSKLAAEPASPLAGEVYYADESNWDPSGIGIGKAYYVLYDGANWLPLWDEDGNWYINKSQAAGNVFTAAAADNLTASEMNSTITVTAEADINIPDGQCDTATGKWLIVKKVGGTHTVSVTSDDTTPDRFYLSDGTALTATAGWEIDLASADASQITLQCIVAHQWWVIGEIGTATDGGTGD